MDGAERVQLPSAFEEVDILHLAVLIADMLDRLIQHNDQIPLLPERLTRFHSRSAPGISVIDYLKRIIRFTNVEKTCLLLTLHYIDRICSRHPLFTLSSLTCHRFVIASITVSSKGICDSFCTNNLYAKVGGITVQELNLLEREFLKLIDWRLVCSREVLQEYYVNLVRTHSTGQYVIIGPQSPVAFAPSPDPMTATSPASPSHQLELTTHSNLDAGLSVPNHPVATMEQNMAFAAHQRSLSRSTAERDEG